MLDDAASNTAAARYAREALDEPSATLVVRVQGREVPLPEPAVIAVKEALAELADGHGVRVLRDDREVTTQEAATFNGKDFPAARLASHGVSRRCTRMRSCTRAFRPRLRAWPR